MATAGREEVTKFRIFSRWQNPHKPEGFTACVATQHQPAWRMKPDLDRPRPWGYLMRMAMRIKKPAPPLFDPEARKKPTNLTVNSDLLAKARKLGINLSASLEHALVEELRRRQAEQWRAENRAAIDAYNEDVGTRGAFSDGLRNF